MPPNPNEPTSLDGRLPEWLEVVYRHAAKLSYGSVQILVHDGRVTQVERIQKTRFVPAVDVQSKDD
jgi:hypothetical protein